ncbi:sporulation-delaying-protein transporter subunit SkiZ [soil metagenome]
MNSVLRRLRRKPLRTVLTLLQVALGALAMTLALSAYLDAYARQHRGQAERFDLIAGYRDEDGSNSTYGVMDAQGAAELAKLAPDVDKVALYAEEWQPTVEKDGRLYQFQQGAYVDNVYFELNDVEPTRGSLFTDQEAAAQDAVAIVSDKAVAILFPDMDPLEQTLKLVPNEDFGGSAAAPVTYRIIGTFADNPMIAEDRSAIYFPLWTYGDSRGGGATLNVMAATGRGDEARAQTLSAARQVFGPKLQGWEVEDGKDFYIREPGERSFGPNPALLDPTIVMFSLFGIVALIVGSIGIFSIMVVDAVERKRDIGIVRALGATRGSVVRAMTLEAALLAGLGGLVGAALAALVIPLLARQVGNNLFWSVNLYWRPLAALLVVAVTLALGTVLGIFPALRAARTQIVQALKAV